jgi:hypothetical protein
MNCYCFPGFLFSKFPKYANQQGFPALQYITLRILNMPHDCQLFFHFFELLSVKAFKIV